MDQNSTSANGNETVVQCLASLSQNDMAHRLYSALILLFALKVWHIVVVGKFHLGGRWVDWWGTISKHVS